MALLSIICVPRLARDAPEILWQLDNGEFKSLI
jgi:hypothetical protein